MLRLRLAVLATSLVSAAALAGAARAAPARSTAPIRPTWLPADLTTRRAAEIATALVVGFVALGLALVWLRRRRFVRQLPPAIDLDDPYRFRG